MESFKVDLEISEFSRKSSMLFHFLARPFRRQLTWHANDSQGQGVLPSAEGGISKLSVLYLAPRHASDFRLLHMAAASAYISQCIFM